MEGPSLVLAQEQLSPFIKKKVLEVSGNSKIGIERFQDQKLLDIFSWGKHLVFQFKDFAVRVHFMLFGSFQATVNDKLVTGDYPKKNRIPRLKFVFANGHIEMYSCSLVIIEGPHVRETYDFKVDIMSKEWDPQLALKHIKATPHEQIGDVLLDQKIFSGVGNIIRNEVQFLAKILPTSRIEELSPKKLKEIVAKTQEFSHQFLAWRRNFELRKHYQIYKKRICTRCKGPVTKQETGHRKRTSYFCPTCQS